MIKSKQMLLFPDVERTQSGPMRPTQHSYDYYARSDRTEIGRIREVLEEWFARFPDNRQPRLRDDFQHDFQGAFFELLIHELLCRTEADVEVHPTLDTAPDTKPDFRVTREQGGQYIVEATVATDESDREAGLRRVREDLLERLAEMEFPGWTFDVVFSRVTSQAESVGPIERELREWMEELDRDEVRRARQEGAYDQVPECTYESDKVTLRFRPIPIDYDPHEGQDWSWGSVGVHAESEEAKVRLPGAGIGDKVEAKRPGRYGEFELPYVVAVNAAARHIPMGFDVLNALYGTLAGAPDSQTGETEGVRLPDGVWHGPDEPQHTRISAVLVGLWLTPWRVTSGAVWLAESPSPQHPYEGALGRLPRLRVEGGRIVEREGASLGQLLGLPDGWPREAL